MDVRVVQLASESLRVVGLRLIETIHRDVIEPKDKVRDGTIWAHPNCLPACFNRILILSKGRVDWPRQESTRHRIARIGLYPKLAGLFCLQQISSGHDIV